MHVFCTNCGVLVPEGEADPARQTAHCPTCGTDFSLAPLRRAQNRNAVQLTHPAPRFAVDVTPDILWVQQEWLTGRTFVKLFFGLIVACGMCAPMAGPLRLLALAFGLFWFYLGLTELVNHTTLELRPGRLSVRNGPLPWRGGLSWDAARIEQLFCRRALRGSAAGEGGSGERFELCALYDGRRQRLLGPVSDPEQLIALEQEIERRLGIADRPVPGELRA